MQKPEKRETDVAYPYSKKTILLYEKYIENAKELQPLKEKIDELKFAKYKKNDKDAKRNFIFWLGWNIFIITSIVLKFIGLPDISVVVNLAAVAFLVPTIVNKSKRFPQDKKYVKQKRELRSKINQLEEENKQIAETLLNIKNNQIKIENKKENNKQQKISEIINKSQLKNNPFLVKKHPNLSTKEDIEKE